MGVFCVYEHSTREKEEKVANAYISEREKILHHEHTGDLVCFHYD